MIAVGLMSGTSLDGIDAARVALRARPRGYDVETLAFVTVPFASGLPSKMRERILSKCDLPEPKKPEIQTPFALNS